MKTLCEFVVYGFEQWLLRKGCPFGFQSTAASCNLQKLIERHEIQEQ